MLTRLNSKPVAKGAEAESGRHVPGQEHVRRVPRPRVEALPAPWPRGARNRGSRDANQARHTEQAASLLSLGVSPPSHSYPGRDSRLLLLRDTFLVAKCGLTHTAHLPPLDMSCMAVSPSRTKWRFLHPRRTEAVLPCFRLVVPSRRLYCKRCFRQPRFSYIPVANDLRFSPRDTPRIPCITLGVAGVHIIWVDRWYIVDFYFATELRRRPAQANPASQLQANRPLAAS